MAQLGHFQTTVQDSSGTALSGVSVTVYREGATFESGSGTTPVTLTVRNNGKIEASDTVFIGTDASTTYTVDSVTDTTVVLSGFAGTLAPTLLDRIVPSNNQPDLFPDDQGGGSAVSNPLTTSSAGYAEAYLDVRNVDYLVSGGGATTELRQAQVISNEEPGRIRYVNEYATGGVGTSGDPWTGWVKCFKATVGNTEYHFPAGTYTPPDQGGDTDNAITLGDNDRVMGQGSKSRIVVSGSWTNGNLFYANQKSGIHISGLYMEGPDPGSGAASNESVQFEGVSDSIIENCEVTKWRLGLALNQDTLGTSLTTQRVTVRNNYIYNNLSASITAKFGPTVDCLIDGNRISDVGISLTHNCDRNIVRGNRIFSVTGVGVKIGGIGTGGAGVTSDFNLIEGNDISACTQGGIFIGDDSGLESQSTGNRAIGNNVHDLVTGTGIAWSRNRRGVIANNIVYNLDEAVADGINVSGTAAGTDGSHNTVTGNMVYDVAGVAIHINGSNAANTAEFNTIVGNVCDTCGVDGIRLNDAVGCTIIGNTLTNCTGDGINFIDACSNNEYHGNVHNSNGEDIGNLTQAITAVGDTIVVRSSLVRLAADASYTLTSTPTIADGYDGQIIEIQNIDGVDTITLQDQGTLGSSNLRFNANTVAIAPGGNITMRFSEDIGDWIQVAPLTVLI